MPARHVRSPRRPARLARGTTLIEAMAAATVFALGIVGLIAAQLAGAQQNQYAARQMRATAVARDIATALQRLPYATLSGRDTTANDTLVFTTTGFSTTVTPANYEIDVNAELATLGFIVQPLSNAAIDYNANGTADFQRYVAIAPLMLDVSGTMTEVGKRLTITVTWSEDRDRVGTRGRRAVHFFQSVYNPTGNKASIPGL